MATPITIATDTRKLNTWYEKCLAQVGVIFRFKNLLNRTQRLCGCAIDSPQKRTNAEKRLDLGI